MYTKLEKITIGLIILAVGVVVWCLVLTKYEEYRLNKVCTERVEATIVDTTELLHTDVNGGVDIDYSATIIYKFNDIEYDSIITNDKLKELSTGDTINIRINPDKATELLVD